MMTYNICMPELVEEVPYGINQRGKQVQNLVEYLERRCVDLRTRLAGRGYLDIAAERSIRVMNRNALWI